MFFNTQFFFTYILTEQAYWSEDLAFMEDRCHGAKIAVI